MIKRIISLLLIFTLFSGISTFAVPSDLDIYDARFENLFIISESTNVEYNIVHKLIDYIGVANAENIRGKDDISPQVILCALAEIIGISYNEDVEIDRIISDLKNAKVLRSNIDANVLTLQDMLYAGTRITGWTTENAIDGEVYSAAKKSGLLKGIEYSTDRNLTKDEAAQFIYNIISVETRNDGKYNPNYISLNKQFSDPILLSKYGIVLKKGIVNSVFGESMFNENKLKEYEIEIDSIVYDFNTEEATADLVGRSTAYFFEVETETVLFVEPLAKNIEYEVKYGAYLSYETSYVEWEDGNDVIEVETDNKTVIVYNGMAVGTYNTEIIPKYFKQGSVMKFIDNDEDNISDVILVRRWESFVAAFEAGSEGTVVFDYGMLYDENPFIDLVPDDAKTHIRVLENGKPADYKKIVTGSILSISGTVNKTGHKYITVELSYVTKNGTINAIDSDGKYIISEKEYIVSESLLNAYKTNSDIVVPKMGETYMFYTDIAGQVANIVAAKDYKFGYLVKLSQGRGMDAKCDVKIFNEDGQMMTVPLAERVVLYGPTSQNGITFKNQPAEFVDRIISEAIQRAGGATEYTGDYRSIIQYSLNKKGELARLWLPVDNTNSDDTPILPFGQTGYQLTKDKRQSGTRTYYGVLEGGDAGNYRVPSSAPIFNVPSDKNAKDELYSRTSMKQAQYLGYIKEPLELYCIDSFNIVSAAVAGGASTGEGDIETMAPLFVVDRVVKGIDEEKEPILKAYGWIDGVEATIITTEEELISDEDKYGTPPENENWGWEVVRFDALKFGDIIQTYQSNGDVRRFRVLFRACNPGIDRIQLTIDGERTSSSPFMYEGQIVDINQSLPFTISVGTYVGRKLNVLKVMQNGVENTFFMYSNRITDVFILDVSAGRFTKSSVADLKNGDKIMLKREHTGVDDVYVVR